MIAATTGGGQIKSIDASVAIAKALEDGGINAHVEVAKYSETNDQDVRAAVGLVIDGVVYGGNGIYGWENIISNRLERPYDDSVIFHEMLTTRHSFENRLALEASISSLFSFTGQTPSRVDETHALYHLLETCMAEIRAATLEEETPLAQNTQQRMRI